MIKDPFNPDLPYRHVNYARMSDEGQCARSPDQQFDMISRTKERCHYDHWVHLGDYRDDGRSGRLIFKRPGFCQMLEDIKAGLKKPNLILVDTRERFGRAKEMKALREELRKRYKVLVLTANTNFANPNDEIGEAYTALEEIRASSDAAKKAYEVVRGKVDAARRGHWPGGPAPTGYMREFRDEIRTRRSGRSITDRYTVLVPDPSTVEIPQRIYDLAYERGWKRDRIAKYLNSDEQFVARFGKISSCRVEYILNNPIYGGTLRHNVLATDIEDDRRIVVEKDESEWVFVENFCEPIVDLQKFEKVQSDRQKSRRDATGNEASDAEGAKLLLPTARGVSVKYPLAGLVRCGYCGSAMRASASGAKSESAASYYYWRCPATLDGRCDNKVYLRGPWLWEATTAEIRRSLFPKSENGRMPDWAPELCEEVRTAIKARLQSDKGQRPMLAAELNQIEQKLVGWRESLANPHLANALRRDIEAQYGQCAERKDRIGTELEALELSDQAIDLQVDTHDVVERIERLDELLSGNNVPDLNMELSRHIVEILVFPGGRVEIHRNRLGALAGRVDTLLSAEQSVSGDPEEEQTFRIRPRQLSRRETASTDTPSPLSRPPGTIEQLAIPERWVDVVSLQQPELAHPYQEHALDIADLRKQGLTHEQLAEQFHLTVPTVRKALVYAQEQGVDLSEVPRKMARRRWHEDHALEVAAKRAEGLGTNELVAFFGKSDVTIRKALVHAATLESDTPAA